MNAPPSISTDAVLANMGWRYAVKEFDAERIIPADQWRALEKTLILSPSSYGLQPWRFLVIQDKAVRQRLLLASMGQRKVAESSHLVVFAARTDIVEVDIERWVARLAAKRKIPASSLEKMRSLMSGDLVTGQRHAIAAEWATRQTYLALGVFLTSAAMAGIDTCPMEGFDPKAYDEVLGLTARGYATVVIVAAGYRSVADTTAADPKVRFTASEVVMTI